ncbi:uncharacterized protein THITE_2131440 [Thermothielavioides terrestris NRRL 8126]|uniref:Uncharacterized protein n=1 Tax=Thermothielavioides terrestris (strain ATCC 38088 / NRRL 8126) TaxID=578455 RepID=G2RD48_THETT|nr:uncharacterized protein THITE_2131440 [Thermothielavioides terrestris NRRL 8126]AEO69883.1 hypothetical protein THITE_2131440 [Thermothielavioides terrestris NRRL 8126]
MANEDDISSVEQKTLSIVRNLLVAPDGTEHATADALEALHAYYRETFCHPDDPSWKRNPARGTIIVAGSAVSHVFDVAAYVPFNDFKHRRLADLVIGLKRNAAQEFNPDDPRLGWDQKVVNEEARETWNCYHHDSMDRCNEAVNMYTLLARLTGAETLGANAVPWATDDVVEGLEEPASRNSTPLVLKAAAVIATQHILYAGEALVKEVDGEKWKTWAAKLRDLADSTPEDAEWDLKHNAREAYGKMVQLRPELFRESSRNTSQ